MTETKEQARARGKKYRAAGKAFEKKVREYLEKDWIVIKFLCNVDLEKNILIQAKAQYNPFFKRIVGEGSGFPDFLIFQPYIGQPDYKGIIGVESKINGYLEKKEKEKCRWLLKNRILNKILIAQKGIKRGEIIFKEFEND